MKVLLDENIDVRLKKSFPPNFEVFTVKDMGWTGLHNGDLIRLLSKNEFDIWIVVDKNIPYQQNVENLSFSIVILDVFRNTIQRLEKLLPQIIDHLVRPISQKIIVIKEQET